MAWRLGKIGIAVGLVVMLLLGLPKAERPSGAAGNQNVLALQFPAFLTNAHAEEASPASLVSDEAGIAAYFQVVSGIDLSTVRGLYRTIEYETATYIIGNIPVPQYTETQDTHVYVHVDGWVMVYYLDTAPVGKIFDWKAYDDGGHTAIVTKLENVAALVAAEAGVAYPGVTYYDFRYPNATHMTLIAEWSGTSTTDSFQITVPGQFAYYQRSWSHAHHSFGGTGGSTYRLDGSVIDENAAYNGQWVTDEGILTGAQLLPDQLHTISIEVGWYVPEAHGGLALVYKEQ